MTNTPKARKPTNPRGKATQAHRHNISVAVAESWKDPEVARKRGTHNEVDVTSPDGITTRFGSTKKAFRALGFDDGPGGNRHIAFRTAMKAAHVTKPGSAAAWVHDGQTFLFRVVDK
ncbi:hypothetical protein [Paraburkholderia terrae]|uniref:hypothetical protein n=1 Tax=Paraburkholderia terrae TaxID=311230 RepID=UPI001EE3413D|nr:hypothetical protein [Paraburkholderia terrae]GJH02771.1 hypothetical protein CBA19C8_19460 [Paraburkholderia terrae]